MSLTNLSTTVNSAQDQEDLYCRPCNKLFPNVQAYRRHIQHTVRHEKLERYAKSAIELSVGASGGVRKDAFSTPSSLNSQDEFDIEESSTTPASLLPPNVVPLTAPLAERVSDVASSTATSSLIRQKRVRIRENARRNAYRLLHSDSCDVYKSVVFINLCVASLGSSQVYTDCRTRIRTER